MSTPRPTSPQYATLVTEGGYRMHVTITLDWGTGAALYRVAELGGTITVGWESGHYHRDCCDGDAMEITYGKPDRSPFTHNFEDAPTVYGVVLADRAVFHPEAMSSTSHWWLVVRREIRDHYSPSAPDGTRRRTAAIVHSITRHMLTRSWADELRGAHDRHQAPARLRHHQQMISELEQEAAKLQEKLGRERERAAAQAAVVAAAGSSAGSVGPPSVPAGGYEQLAA
jgi:hypothetical protein